jgi:hypothetical protein
MFSLSKNPKRKKNGREPLINKTINKSSLVPLANLSLYAPNTARLNLSSIDTISLMRVVSFLGNRDLFALAHIKGLRQQIKKYISDDKIKELNVDEFAKSFEAYLNQDIGARAGTLAIPKKISCICLFSSYCVVVIGLLGLVFYGILEMAKLNEEVIIARNKTLDSANSLYDELKLNATTIFSFINGSCMLLEQEASAFCRDLDCYSIDKMFLNCAPFEGKDINSGIVPSWPSMGAFDPAKAFIPCATFVFKVFQAEPLFAAYEQICDGATTRSHIYELYALGLFVFWLMALCACAIFICSGECAEEIKKQSSHIESTVRLSVMNGHESINNAPPEHAWFIRHMEVENQTVGEVLPKVRTLAHANKKPKTNRRDSFFNTLPQERIVVISDVEDMDISAMQAQQECNYGQVV